MKPRSAGDFYVKAHCRARRSPLHPHVLHLQRVRHCANVRSPRVALAWVRPLDQVG
jgi:hypothetical protein